MKGKLLLTAAATLFSVPLMAARPVSTNYADVYFVPSAEITVDDGFGDVDIDGDGYGVKAQFPVARDFALIGEYQSNTYDDGFGDYDTIRLGAGFGPGIANGAGIYGTAEYINADFEFADEDDNGFALNVGYAFKPTREFRFYGQVGYADIGDADGIEFLGGGAYQFTPFVGVFADYRTTQLEVDGGTDIDFNDFRVGARFYF